MIRKFSWLVVVGGVLIAVPAKAHLLSCDKTVNGEGIVHLNHYPAKLKYRMSVKNIHPDSPSLADSASDPLLEAHGFNFSPQAPFTLSLDEEVHSDFTLKVKSYQHCLSLAAQDGIADGIIDNVFNVSWDSGSASCTARVYCEAPPPPSKCKHKDCKGKNCKHKDPKCEHKDCKGKKCKHKDPKPDPKPDPKCKHKDCKGKSCKHKDPKPDPKPDPKCKGKDCKDKQCKGKVCKDKDPKPDPKPDPKCKGGKSCKFSKNCKGGKYCPGLKKSVFGFLRIFFGKTPR